MKFMFGLSNDDFMELLLLLECEEERISKLLADENYVRECPDVIELEAMRTSKDSYSRMLKSMASIIVENYEKGIEQEWFINIEEMKKRIQ